MFPPETQTGVVERQPLFWCKHKGGIMNEKLINDLFDRLKKRDEEFCLAMEGLKINVELLTQRQDIASKRLEALEDINNIMSGNYGNNPRNHC
tara:strand:+ start:1906 stop:2184 length:279 start_codon:yes stop_codon:yes gene_type:complete